jgi:hypothetical protein
MNLELKKFDMKTISFKPNESKGPVVVLIGRRDTGKSFLVRDLLFYHQDIPIGTVISGTEEGNDDGDDDDNKVDADNDVDSFTEGVVSTMTSILSIEGEGSALTTANTN